MRQNVSIRQERGLPEESLPTSETLNYVDGLAGYYESLGVMEARQLTVNEGRLLHVHELARLIRLAQSGAFS
jgi:hypothetical protein